MSRVLVHVAALFGSTAGGVMVKVDGSAGEEHRSETWCVFAAAGGERIPSALPAIAADMILRKEIAGTGIVPPTDWIARDQLFDKLAARGIGAAVRSEGGEWRAVGKE